MRIRRRFSSIISVFAPAREVLCFILMNTSLNVHCTAILTLQFFLVKSLATLNKNQADSSNILYSFEFERKHEQTDFQKLKPMYHLL